MAGDILFMFDMLQKYVWLLCYERGVDIKMKSYVFRSSLQSVYYIFVAYRQKLSERFILLSVKVDFK